MTRDDDADTDRDGADGAGEDAPEPTPDSDPRHIDPAGHMADLFESGEIDVDGIDVQNDPEELREFVERAEAGEYDADPGLEATVRIARTMLENMDTGEDAAADPDSRE